MTTAIGTWHYLIVNRKEAVHVTVHGSGNIYKFLLLRHASVPLGKTVTATGLTAITVKTGCAMKLTGRRTQFNARKSIGP